MWGLVRQRVSHSTTFRGVVRRYSSLQGKGTVVGIYDHSDKGFEFSKYGSMLDQQLSGKIKRLIDISGPMLKKGEARIFHDVSSELSHMAVVNVGEKEPNEGQEDILVYKENVRVAAGVATSQLQNAQVQEVIMDDFSDPQSAAEGAHLALYHYTDMKGSEFKDNRKAPLVSLSSDENSEAWSKGVVLAGAQNFARWLMDTPSNHMTPTTFVHSVTQKLGELNGNIKDKLKIHPRPLSWIKDKNMGAFLAVAKGSIEEPWFLEITYNGGDKDKQPLAFVGKGITFDSGGISIKPAQSMGDMKADMGGAACVAGALLGIASLQLPLNLVAVLPLCENMPSGSAFKPGDVITAMNGKTIEVGNTDAEGRLILADALTHVHSYDPAAIIDLATLTGAIAVALGTGAAGTYTTSSSLWELLHKASRTTGDRLWRMPLFSQYRKQIDTPIADLSNIGTLDRMAGSCTAAAFLKDFVSINEWSHIDIAGVMDNKGEIPYMRKGMAGRPTRTLVEFAECFHKLK